MLTEWAISKSTIILRSVSPLQARRLAGDGEVKVTVTIELKLQMCSGFSVDIINPDLMYRLSPVMKLNKRFILCVLLSTF